MARFESLLNNAPLYLITALLGALIAFVALYATTRISISISILQMEQVRDEGEARRSTDLALTKAIRELTNELRRHPEISPSVTLALFAAPECRKRGCEHSTPSA